MTLDDPPPRRVVALGAAAVSFVLLECLRIWFPSLLMVVGDPGVTSAPLLAAGGLLVLAIAPLTATLVGRVGVRVLWAVGGGVLAAGRLALLVVDGGLPQAAASSAAVAGGAVAISALAAGAVASNLARVGVLVGLAAATSLHAATGSTGLIWGASGLPLAVSLVVVVGLVVAVHRTGAGLVASVHEPKGGAAWPWLVLAPLLVLVGMVSGVPGRLAVASGWPPPVVAGIVAGAHVAAVLAALLAPRLGPTRAGRTGAGLVVLGAAGSLDAAGWPGTIGPVVLAVGLGLVVGADADHVGTRSSGRRRALVAGASFPLFGLVVGLYYATYDVVLPLNNRWLLLGAAALAAALGAAAARTGRSTTTRASIDTSAAIRLVGVAVLLVALVAVSARPGGVDAADAPADDRIRVGLLNIRSGFDVEGRFAAEEQARVLRSYTPDVVVLNEVDRGWLATGGHDALDVLARELGLPHVAFAPAADELWGNAVLSRHPIIEQVSERLPQGADPMRRGELSVLLDLGDERRLGVVATHLSHLDTQGDTRLPQARSVAASAARFRERQVPTIVVGDLNAEPNSSELASFSSLLDPMIPPGTDTYPSHAPSRQIDHVLASPDLRRVTVQVPQVEVSDHLPVVVTLELVSATDP